MLEAFVPTAAATEKLQVTAAEVPEIEPAELKNRFAEKVRTDSRDRQAPTDEQAILELAGALSTDRVRAIILAMDADASCSDIKAMTAPSGRIYLFSTTYLSETAAASAAFAEEVKLAIAARIRADSRDLLLTCAQDLGSILPSEEPERQAALLAELRADPRFRDIQSITGPDGEVYFHSDEHLSTNYGKILLRAKANKPYPAIAEFVRDRSRVIPAPTKLTLFEDQAFRLTRANIEAFLAEFPKATSEFADIKKLVHPVTGAVYLYSGTYLSEAAAFRMMDWDEVGAAQNP